MAEGKHHHSALLGSVRVACSAELMLAVPLHRKSSPSDTDCSYQDGAFLGVSLGKEINFSKSESEHLYLVPVILDLKYICKAMF